MCPVNIQMEIVNSPYYPKGLFLFANISFPQRLKLYWHRLVGLFDLLLSVIKLPKYLRSFLVSIVKAGYDWGRLSSSFNFSKASECFRSHLKRTFFLSFNSSHNGAVIVLATVTCHPEQTMHFTSILRL